jgi:type IV pilus assembly protein PilM
MERYRNHASRMISAKKKTSPLVGLDIEAGSVAATQLAPGARNVGRTAIAQLQPGAVEDGEVRDPAALSQALQGLFSEYKLGKTVRLGIANQRVVVRTFELPLIEDPKEIETAVRFRAQDQIPMPLDDAVLDHRVIGRREGDEGQRVMDVLAVAARRDMVFSLLEALRGAGLQPAGIDLSAFGMIRALGSDAPLAPAEGEGMPANTVLYCHLGDVTNLAVARGGQCVFTRVAPFGIETIAERLASRREIPLEQARESLMEVGLEDELELFADRSDAMAAAREVLEEGAAKLVDELRLSLDFYSAQEGVTPVDRVVICGAGTTIPGLPERIQVGLGLGVTTEKPAALSHLDEEDAARLTVSYGLALEN